MKKKKNFDLDKEEQKISDAFDRGELKSVANLKQEIALAKKTAANFLCKRRSGKVDPLPNIK